MCMHYTAKPVNVKGACSLGLQLRARTFTRQTHLSVVDGAKWGGVELGECLSGSRNLIAISEVVRLFNGSVCQSSKHHATGAS